MTKYEMALLLTVVVLAGCVTLQKTSGGYIELQRTPCFGSCPVYTVTLLPDGKVVYQGDRFVAEKGKRTANISPAQVDALFGLALENDFYALPGNIDETCPITMTDMPGTMITIKTYGKKHKVREQSCALLTDFHLKGYKHQVSSGERSQAKLDSLWSQSRKVEGYLDRFHGLAKAIDSIAVTRQWVEN